MRHSIRKPFVFLAALGVLSLLSVGHAHATQTNPATEENADSLSLLTTHSVALSETEMEDSRGASGTNTVSSNQSVVNTTSGNAITVGGDMTNGTISVGDNLSGFGSFVMNSGNNSTISSAFSLNVQIMPTTP